MSTKDAHNDAQRNKKKETTQMIHVERREREKKCTKDRTRREKKRGRERAKLMKLPSSTHLYL